jgi:hypothetical protein
MRGGAVSRKYLYGPLVEGGNPGPPQGTVTSLEAHRSARLDLQKDRTLRRRIDHPDGGMMRTLMRRSWIG